jgi:hypothetical protein
MNEQEKLEHKISMYRKISQQYMRDLKMWVAAHASEYPARRIEEVFKDIEEIETLGIDK